MKHHFTKTSDFVIETFEQMIQEFNQNPSVASFDNLEAFFNIVRETSRIVGYQYGYGDTRYFLICQEFEKIKSMMADVERQRLIQKMLQTPGINNRYNL